MQSQDNVRLLWGDNKNDFVALREVLKAYNFQKPYTDFEKAYKNANVISIICENI